MLSNIWKGFYGNSAGVGSDILEKTSLVTFEKYIKGMLYMMLLLFFVVLYNSGAIILDFFLLLF